MDPLLHGIPMKTRTQSCRPPGLLWVPPLVEKVAYLLVLAIWRVVHAPTGAVIPNTLAGPVISFNLILIGWLITPRAIEGRGESFTRHERAFMATTP
jgi:hypothetical protein